MGALLIAGTSDKAFSRWNTQFLSEELKGKYSEFEAYSIEYQTTSVFLLIRQFRGTGEYFIVISRNNEQTVSLGNLVDNTDWPFLPVKPYYGKFNISTPDLKVLISSVDSKYKVLEISASDSSTSITLSAHFFKKSGDCSTINPLSYDSKSFSYSIVSGNFLVQCDFNINDSKESIPLGTGNMIWNRGIWPVPSSARYAWGTVKYRRTQISFHLVQYQHSPLNGTHDSLYMGKELVKLPNTIFRRVNQTSWTVHSSSTHNSVSVQGHFQQAQLLQNQHRLKTFSRVYLGTFTLRISFKTPFSITAPGYLLETFY